MRLHLRFPSSQEPVFLEEVKTYLRLTSDQEDDLLRNLISASRAAVENITGRALLKQRWTMQLTPPYPPSFPLVKNKTGELTVILPLPPLLGVESVKAGEQDVPYEVEEDRVILSPLLWGKALSIDFWAGYGETSASLPPDLKMAVLMGIRFLYEGQAINLPLLRPYKVMRLM
ncbi:MAG: phage head-tail connector protein [Proteobacteria bacterium]|nr:phage head-tail connector protein [Pseudomonadota bacterium]